MILKNPDLSFKVVIQAFYLSMIRKLKCMSFQVELNDSIKMFVNLFKGDYRIIKPWKHYLPLEKIIVMLRNYNTKK